MAILSITKTYSVLSKVRLRIIQMAHLTDMMQMTSKGCSPIVLLRLEKHWRRHCKQYVQCAK